MKIIFRFCIFALFSFSALVMSPAWVQAANGNAVTPATIWQTWNWDVPIFTGLMFGLWLYNCGLVKLWRRLGFGRGIRYWQVTAFGVGWFAIFLALISPLESLSHSLFSAHMFQHILLIMVAAPLLVISEFQTAFLAALPRNGQQRLAKIWKGNKRLQRLWNFISQPVMAWAIGVGIIWTWHIPALYVWALNNDLIHGTEHLLFLLASMLFWWPLLKPGQKKYVTYGAHVLYLFTATLQGSALGALLTFSGQPWYSAYSLTTETWNFTPLQDQQLAGIVMWLPGGLLYLVAALVFFVLWFANLERRMQQIQQPSPEQTGGI